MVTGLTSTSDNDNNNQDHGPRLSCYAALRHGGQPLLASQGAHARQHHVRAVRPHHAHPGLDRPQEVSGNLLSIVRVTDLPTAPRSIARLRTRRRRRLKLPTATPTPTPTALAVTLLASPQTAARPILVLPTATGLLAPISPGAAAAASTALRRPTATEEVAAAVIAPVLAAA